jgi:hypothetical protein
MGGIHEASELLDLMAKLTQAQHQKAALRKNLQTQKEN